MPVDANCWATLEEVKSQLHISISDSDCNTFLIHLLNVCYPRIEKYISRPVKAQTFTEYYSGDDSGVLLLRKWPVISVTSIHVDAEREFGSDTLMESSNYFVDTDSDTSIGTVEIYKYDGSYPSWFSKGVRNIKVVYQAGWLVAPAPLKHALIQLVGWHYKHSGNEAIRQASIGGFSKTFENDDLPGHIKNWLADYKERSV